MNRPPKPRNRRLGCGGIAALVLTGMLLLMLGGCATIVLQNDAAARAVADRLVALPLPPGAERVAVASRAGKLVGNGNGMQYLGAMLIRSEADPEAIIAFYDAQADIGSGITVTRSVALEESEISVAAGILGVSGRADEYVVSAWGAAPSWFHADFDLRGH